MMAVHVARQTTMFYALIGLTATCMAMTKSHFSVDPDVKILRLHMIESDLPKLEEVIVFKESRNKILRDKVRTENCNGNTVIVIDKRINKGDKSLFEDHFVKESVFVFDSIDEHDIRRNLHELERLRNHPFPCVVHVSTEFARGFDFATKLPTVVLIAFNPSTFAELV